MPRKNKNQQELPLSGMDNAADTATLKASKYYLTAQQEEFIQLIVQGKKATEAYVIAYKKPTAKTKQQQKTYWEKASRLKNSDKVQARLQEITQKALTNPAIITKTQILQEMSEICFLDIHDKEGNVIAPILNPKKGALIAMGEYYKLWDLVSTEDTNKATVKMGGGKLIVEFIDSAARQRRLQEAANG